MRDEKGEKRGKETPAKKKNQKNQKTQKQKQNNEKKLGEKIEQLGFLKMVLCFGEVEYGQRTIKLIVSLTQKKNNKTKNIKKSENKKQCAR